MNKVEDYGMIDNALMLALMAHGGAIDKGGNAFILHPLRIMAKMRTEELKAVAILHDVIEDSELTGVDLLFYGLPEHVVDAVICLTRDDDESYEDYINNKVMSNRMSIEVKIADIEDNINVLRLKALTTKDFDHITKYHKTWKKLTAMTGERDDR